LQAQRRALEEKRRSPDQAIEAIRDAERVIQPGIPINSIVLKKIIEVIQMQDHTEYMKKYYSVEAWAKMAGRRPQWKPQMEAEATKAWGDLFRDVEAAINEDPAGAKAQSLADRWTKLVESFTQGDPGVSTGVRNAWADREHWPSQLQQETAQFGNKAVWEFI